MENTQEKLNKLLQAYVPEFSYSAKEKDPGSVLTRICGDMIEDSAKRFDQVIPRSRIQYLNLFDSMVKEPVCAARGYASFIPVPGHTGMVPVPKNTQVLANNGAILFETEHDLTVTDTTPQVAIMTDGRLDKMVIHELKDKKSFTAFDVSGESKTCHKLYLGFEKLFSHVKGLDFQVVIKAAVADEQEDLLAELTGENVTWSILGEPEGEEYTEIPFSTCEIKDGGIHLALPGYEPVETTVGQKTAVFLVISAKDKLPQIYMESLRISFAKKDILPEEKYVNGIARLEDGIAPFGKPMGLYNEFSFDDAEVLSRRGAKINISFDLSYQIHQETLEIPEFETEYKNIMKKPRKALVVEESEIHADYIHWEYLSTEGWKNLFAEPYVNTLCNGSQQGPISLDFICPADMAEKEDATNGRIRVRLISAENIYHVPASYHCPFFSDFKLSYSYEEDGISASFAMSRNNYDEKDLTKPLAEGGNVLPFYPTEQPQRCMYLGFDNSFAGTPFGLYFHLENYSDLEVPFTAEYLGPNGFTPIRVIDYTDGFCGSGVMLMVIPTDAVREVRYGFEGYFLRFKHLKKDIPNYTLPVIHGLYPNMARIVNRSSVVEEFYVDDVDTAVELQLNQQNLLKASVWVHELDAITGEPQWVPWEVGQNFYEGGRTYQIDKATGQIQFRKSAFALVDLVEEGPHIRVEHSNYTGSKANLNAGEVNTMGISIRYIADVTNPFPTYGGYDSYSEGSQMDYVSGLLRTRNRAVTAKDYFDIISQCAHGICKVKCVNHVDPTGALAPEDVTVAVLIQEYEKGAHVFSEIKRDIRNRLLKDSALPATGRNLNLIQPHFVKVSVRVWLSKEDLDQAYDMQQKAQDLIRDFINPLTGGPSNDGWEIGVLPRTSQIVAALRNGIPGCNISKIVMTAMVDGKEVPVDDSFNRSKNPFLMAVSGEHVVYIEVN